jgi:flagellar protein FliO/FliZ
MAGAYSAPAGARAENTPLDLGKTTASHASGASASGASITRTLLGLVVVVALIYAVTWVLRKLKRQEGRVVGSGLESVASLPLGPGRSLALVRAGSELVLVGVAEQQVTPIRRYSEDEARAAGLLGDDDLLARIDTLTPDGARSLSRSIGADPPPTERSLQGVLEALRNWTVRS